MNVIVDISSFFKSLRLMIKVILEAVNFQLIVLPNGEK